MEKQVYLALGTLLIGAVMLEIDDTLIEGFDHVILDEALGIKEQGLKSIVIAVLGDLSDGDFYDFLPKSHLPADDYS
jgi:nitroreductase/dihydropteridine reductase